jgi:hypothetical protein
VMKVALKPGVTTESLRLARVGEEIEC